MTGDSATGNAAEAATAYHALEIGKHKNYGYLSIWDPAYYPGGGQWDSHNASEAFWLLRAAQLLGRQRDVAVAVAHYKAYAPHAGSGYLQFMACHFTELVPEADDVCIPWQESGAAGSPVLGLRLLGLVTRY